MLELNERMIENTMVIVPNLERLDSFYSDVFKKSVLELISRGPDRVIINMSNIGFIDSSGLGALVACLKQLGDPERIPLFEVGPAVMSLFKLTRMNEVFHLYATEQDALRGSSV